MRDVRFCPGLPKIPPVLFADLGTGPEAVRHFIIPGGKPPFPHPVIADAKLEAGDVSPQLLLDKAFVSGCFPVLQRPPVPPGRLRIPFFSKKPPADIAAKLRAGNGEPQSLQERGQRFFFLGQPIQAVGAVAAGVYLILPPAVRTLSKFRQRPLRLPVLLMVI